MNRQEVIGVTLRKEGQSQKDNNEARGDAPDDGSAFTSVQKSATALVDLILSSHHEYLKATLPRIGEMVEKLSERKELAPLFDWLDLLSADITMHLMKEEQILFPMIKEAESALAESRAAQLPPCGINGPIAQMNLEHNQALRLLQEMEEFIKGKGDDGRAALPEKGTGNLSPGDPDSKKVEKLFAVITELSADLREHIRKEEEELFPLALNLMEFP